MEYRFRYEYNAKCYWKERENNFHEFINRCKLRTKQKYMQAKEDALNTKKENETKYTYEKKSIHNFWRIVWWNTR